MRAARTREADAFEIAKRQNNVNIIFETVESLQGARLVYIVVTSPEIVHSTFRRRMKEEAFTHSLLKAQLESIQVADNDRQ